MAADTGVYGGCGGAGARGNCVVGRRAPARGAGEAYAACGRGRAAQRAAWGIAAWRGAPRRPRAAGGAARAARRHSAHPWPPACAPTRGRAAVRT
eukprot:978436-Prymnesium_polylepis.1